MRDDYSIWAALLAFGVPLSVIALAILISWLSPKKKSTLLGTTLASLTNGLQPDRLYDVTIVVEDRFNPSNALHRFSGVKILGATDTTEKGWFNEWVVLEHGDGHKSFVPRTGICFIEESVEANQI